MLTIQNRVRNSLSLRKTYCSRWTCADVVLFRNDDCFPQIAVHFVLILRLVYVIMVEYKHSHVILNLHHFVILKSSSSSINLLARVILSHEKVFKLLLFTYVSIIMLMPYWIRFSSAYLRKVFSHLRLLTQYPMYCSITCLPSVLACLFQIFAFFFISCTCLVWIVDLRLFLLGVVTFVASTLYLRKK